MEKTRAEMYVDKDGVLQLRHLPIVYDETAPISKKTYDIIMERVKQKDNKGE